MEHSVPRWSLLPDHLWLHVFERLALNERHRGPALVCRSWAQLVCAPQLLASQALQFSGTGRRLRLFAAWVAQRAAGHVRRLELTISSRAGEEDEDDENQEEAVATAAACAVACCAAGGLEHLELVAEEAWLRLGGWAAALRGLRQLEVTTWGMNYLDMKAPLAGLTTLQDLYLFGAPLCIMPEEGASLPTSLTKLRLSTTASEQPPLDLTPLSRLHKLRHLYVNSADTPGEGYDALLSMSSLQTLVLNGCDHLPACLPQLSQLQALHVRDTPYALHPEAEEMAASAAQLDEALSQLTQLTRLFLQTLEYCERLPPALADMEDLRVFSWSCQRLWDPDLPPGAWMDGLRQLSLPVECLVSSPAQLPRLRRLEELELICGYRECHPPPPWQPTESELAVVRGAGRLPRLRHLHIFMQVDQLAEGQQLLQAALDDAVAANPALLTVGEGLYRAHVVPSMCGYSWPADILHLVGRCT